MSRVNGEASYVYGRAKPEGFFPLFHPRVASERIVIAKRLEIAFEEQRLITTVRNNVVGDGGGGGPTGEAAGPAEWFS